MFQNLRLWAKIMAVMGLAIGSVGAVLTFTGLSSMSRLVAEAEQNALQAHFKFINNAIAVESRSAEALSAVVASIPLVQEKFDSGDRKALASLFVPGFNNLKNNYGVEQFQFHQPPATSWLRVHMPEKFGDDLSAFRFTVLATNKTQKPVRGLEGGVAGLGVRGVVPVLHQGKHVGSVEFGLSLGQAFFEYFKQNNQVETSLHVLDKDGRFKTLVTTFGQQPLLDSEVLKRALDGQPQLAHLPLGGKPYAVYAAAINDYSGRPIGVLEIAMDSSSYQAMLRQSRWTAWAVGIVSILFGLALAMWLARHLSARLDQVATGVNNVARGDLSQSISLSGRDEIAALAQATHAMQDKLRALVAEVNANAAKVHQAAQQITGAVENQAAASTEMSSSVAEITSTVEELSASSTQIADHSKSVVDIANQTLDSSRQGSEAMQTVLGRMGDIRSDNQTSLQEIVALGNKSKQISKVMELINAVADQTKLIAFNAALEASSAGEAGKRFSVVAAEIRRLADNVTVSTNEIESKINEIQDSISRLVINSEKGAASISSGLEASANTAERLNDIVAAASHTTNAAQQISLSTQQQKIASNQVVIALREIVAASSHTAQSMAHISEVSKEMSALSARLDELVQQFQLGTEARPSAGDNAHA